MELQPFGPEEQAFQDVKGSSPPKKSTKNIVLGVFVIIAIAGIFYYVYTVTESKKKQSKLPQDPSNLS